MLLYNTYKKLVAIYDKRNNTAANEKLLLGGKKMSQARTLSEKELNLLLLYINTKKHASRNRAMVLMTFWGGMRIGEVAATKIGDVLALDGTIKQEIHLTAEQTKGKHSRTVVLADKLRKELLSYLQQRFETKKLDQIDNINVMQRPLFYTQKREGFSAATACWHLHMLYKEAGLDGASSHSGRRQFLSFLSSKSVPLKVLMELAGHRQAQTTMKYVDVTMDMKKAAVELI